MGDTLINSWNRFTLNYKPLTLEEIKGLASAGMSSEFRPLRSTVTSYTIQEGKEHIASNVQTNELPARATPEILSSLHFRAYRNLSASGYQPHDIAGYIEWSEADLEQRGESVRHLSRGEEGRVYATEYFLKDGRKKG